MFRESPCAGAAGYQVTKSTICIVLGKNLHRLSLIVEDYALK